MTGDDDVELCSELVSCRMAISRLSFNYGCHLKIYLLLLSVWCRIWASEGLSHGVKYRMAFNWPLSFFAEMWINILSRFSVLGVEKI